MANLLDWIKDKVDRDDTKDGVQLTSQKTKDFWNKGVANIKQSKASDYNMFAHLGDMAVNSVGKNKAGYALAGATEIPSAVFGFGGQKQQTYNKNMTSEQDNARRAGKFLYGTALTSPFATQGALSRALPGMGKNLLIRSGTGLTKQIAGQTAKAIGGQVGLGAAFGAGSNTVEALTQKRLPTIDEIKTGAVQGAENSWVFPVTSAATNTLLKYGSKSFPFLNKYTDKAMRSATSSIKNKTFREMMKKIPGAMVNSAVREAAETPLETAYFASQEPGKFTENFKNRFVEDLITNFAIGAGRQGLQFTPAMFKSYKADLSSKIDADARKAGVTVDVLLKTKGNEYKQLAQKELTKPGREKISVTNKYDGAESAYAVVRPNGTGAITVKLKPEAKGAGLGSAIAKDLEGQLAQKGVKKIELSAFDESVGFWEKQGYKVDGKTGTNTRMIKILPSSGPIANDMNIRVGDGYKVGSTTIGFEKLMDEGWRPDQIDYAVKLANNSPTSIKNPEGYIRGVLKQQYPQQTVKPEDKNMVDIPEAIVKNPSQDQATKDRVIKVVRDKGYESVARQLESEPPITAEPPRIKIAQTETNLSKQNESKRAELEAGDLARQEISNALIKEGFDNKTQTVEEILAGNTKASPELVKLITTYTNKMGAESVKWKNIPESKLKENYVPHVKKDSITPVDTESDDITSMMNRNTYDPSKKRQDLINPEDMADATTSYRQAQIAILNEKYYDSEQANKIMQENNLPESKADEVLDFVTEQRKKADKVVTEHIEKTDFGKSRDYLSESHQSVKEKDKLIGTETEIPVVKATERGTLINAIDTLQSEVRSDALFFKDKTNDEIYNAFLDYKLSQAGENPQPYKSSVNKFIRKLTSFDYEDKAVRDRVNLYIDNKLKENMVLEKTSDKAIRAATEVFSMAQIGHNIKTVVTQSTEAFRIIPEHGLGSFLEGAKASFNKAEMNRLRNTYLSGKESSGNLAQNPIYKEANKTTSKEKLSKGYEGFKNFLFYGLQVSEDWKNIVYLKAMEDAGTKKGLQGDELKRFVLSETFRLAHIADTDMTPKIMKNNAKASGLLQYSQYLLKNEILKWDTLVDKDSSAGTKAKKLTGLFLADLASIATIAGVTGVPVRDFMSWVSGSGLPSGFGPIITVPYQMAAEAYRFSQLSQEEQDKQSSLMDREKAILFRNFVPAGNQISKTKNTIDILKNNYSESRKGNINFMAGDNSIFKNTQALAFGPGALPNKIEANKKWDNIEKDKIYPTLNSQQSQVLRAMPRDRQEAYYNEIMNQQIPLSTKIKNEEKQPNVFARIIGGKKDKVVDEFDISTPKLKAEKMSLVDEKIKQGVELTPEETELKYFDEYNSMPTGSRYELREKEKKGYEVARSIVDNDFIPQEQKDAIYKKLETSEEELRYYDVSDSNDDDQRMYITDEIASMSEDERTDFLVRARSVVNGKILVTDTIANKLYDEGVISKGERDALKSFKYIKDNTYTGEDAIKMGDNTYRPEKIVDRDAGGKAKGFGTDNVTNAKLPTSIGKAQKIGSDGSFILAPKSSGSSKMVKIAKPNLQSGKKWRNVKLKY